uniref:Putative cyclin-dependent kinase inhibitor n=1 Tax=Tabanus bromius TaxID=304241 RepID=A0A0K8TRC4_TABBR
MSTRVLYPVALTDFCPIHRSRPPSAKINVIKKALFGQPDIIQTRESFKEQIESHQKAAAQRWGFDFLNGRPVVGHKQFIWEPLQISEFIPEMYTLSRAAHVREVPSLKATTSEEELLDERAARQNNDSLIKYEESSEDESILFKVPSDDRQTLSGQKSTKRQPKITEYMKERKRLAPTPKKVLPAKRTRSSTSSFQTSSLAKHLRSGH